MIAVLTACFVLSAVTGIEKGVQFLSNANAIAAVLLVFFLFVVGPTVFILSTFTESLGGYLTHLPTMAFRTGAFGNSEFLNTWTIFYWAWWISWTPFVGMFIARISKGRTIRQFVVYVILVPSIVSFVWFSILAGAAFDLQLSGAKDLGAVLADEGTESALFTTLREYPLASVTVVLAVFLVAIFFITGADSASIVMGMLSQHGKEEPMRWLVIFWGVAQGAVAAVLLFSGGLGALADPRDHRGGAVHAGDLRDVRLADEVAAPGALRVDPAVPRAQGRPARAEVRLDGPALRGPRRPRRRSRRGHRRLRAVEGVLTRAVPRGPQPVAPGHLDSASGATAYISRVAHDATRCAWRNHHVSLQHPPQIRPSGPGG